MMNNPIVWMVMIVVFIASFLFVTYYKNYVLKQLLTYLKEQKYDEFMKKLDSFSCKYFYPAFNREYLRLSAYVIKGDLQKVRDQFDCLLQMRKNRKQEIDVYTKAFYFYIDEQNEEKAHALLQKIKELKEDALLQECTIIFDIFLKKSTAYIDDMEQSIDQMEGANKGMFHYMLAMQYGYLHEDTKRLHHLTFAYDLLRNTAYELRVKTLLEEAEKAQ